MGLRPYQIDLINGVTDCWNSGKRRVMMQLPTGGGKTVVFSQIVRHFSESNKRVLMFVHRNELVSQMMDELSDLSVPCDSISSNRKLKINSLVQCGMIQTLNKRDLSKFPKYDLIVCDEAHHSTADTYRNLYAKYPNANILGVSATPVRTNGEGFSDLFDTMVCGPSVKDLINMGYLTKFKIFDLESNFNYENLKKGNGDFTNKELDNFAKNGLQSSDIVKTYLNVANDKKGICFGANKYHCESIVEAYRDLGIPCAYVDGDTEKSERRIILSDFKNNYIKVLVNINLFTEGFNIPDIEFVQLARPTASLALYLQMIGRVLRLSKGKEFGLILDHVKNVIRHGTPDMDIKWTLKGALFNQSVSEKEDKDFEVNSTEKISTYKEYEIFGENVLSEAFSFQGEKKQDPWSINIDSIILDHQPNDSINPDIDINTFISNTYYLKKYAESRGIKKAWVMHEMHKIVDKRPLSYEERVMICRILEYKPGYQYKINDYLIGDN